MERPALRSLVLSAIVLTAGLAGCLSGDKSGSAASRDAQRLGGSASASGGRYYPVGVHPYPTGEEWPQELVGPFERKAILDVTVVSFDGVDLHGWIYLPKLPEGVKAPVVLWSSPYFGQTQQPGDSEALARNSVVPVNLLVREGYAVALFNVRGTGNSGGCFEFFGAKEQKDQAVLVEWLAAQTWSNGRVGMMGLSYHGTTPWEAAIQNPPALKTIVVAGMVSDLFTFFHTPQGAVFTVGPGFGALVTGLVSIVPPSNALGQQGALRQAPLLPGRLCPEVVQMQAILHEDALTDRRDAPFWNARRLIDKFPGITTSVFLTHGFQDNHGSGHQQQELWAWSALGNIPKRQLEGQWGHEFPNSNTFRSQWAMSDWHDRAFEWLDFWLKGVGPIPPGVGTVDYQDGTGAWHSTTAWPPADAREEVLYLTEGALSPAPKAGSVSFRSIPVVDGPDGVLCARGTGALPYGRVFSTAAATEPVLVAGNPFAYLRLRSDLPGGLVALHVYDVAPHFACTNTGVTGARLLVAGVADLRFHTGTFQGRDFPMNTAMQVRVDITNLADVVDVGHRLVVVASYGEPTDRTSQPFYPAITLEAGTESTASHVVLPIVRGSFGGAAPTLDYPPRPYLPPGVSE